MKQEIFTLRGIFLEEVKTSHYTYIIYKCHKLWRVRGNNVSRKIYPSCIREDNKIITSQAAKSEELTR